MFHPTDVNVITAEDGTKALVISLDLIVPLHPDFIPGIAAELLGIEAPQPELDTEQDNDNTEVQAA